DDDILAVHRIRRREAGNDAPGDTLQQIDVRARCVDDGEFIAAEPSHEIVTAEDFVEPKRDVADQFVADRMPECIVDVLEMVEVDVENGPGAASGANLLDCGFKALAEKHPVRQAA